MLSLQDAENKHIVLINALEKKTFRMANWNIQIEDTETGKVLTKIHKNKVLALFVFGTISITSPTIDILRKYAIPFILMKGNLRPVLVFAPTAEGNFLLRKKQYLAENTLEIAQALVVNKISNQKKLLLKIRKKNDLIDHAVQQCESALNELPAGQTVQELMGYEGACARAFFRAYYHEWDWKNRTPRAKTDPLNTTMDIGYTILFNYMEANARLFGFDPYVGFLHQLWFQRKSLICDLVEPFRCIIDQTIRKAFNRKQFKMSDFNRRNHAFHLDPGVAAAYQKIFFQEITARKNEIYRYTQAFYRCFMGRKSIPNYPQFTIE